MDLLLKQQKALVRIPKREDDDMDVALRKYATLIKAFYTKGEEVLG
jgi:hypothetical protein